MSRNEKTEFLTAFEVARHSGVPFFGSLVPLGCRHVGLTDRGCLGFWRTLVRFPGLSDAPTFTGCLRAGCNRSARVRATALAGAGRGCRRNCARGRLGAHDPPFQYARLAAASSRGALLRN